MQFVMTGCPRSATTYAAELMTAAGIPCGHERVLRYAWPDGSLRLRHASFLGTEMFQGESSWVGAPFLHHFDMPRVHLVRAPLNVIASELVLDWARDEDPHNRGVIEKYAPRVYDEPWGPRRMARFWLDWNALVDAVDEKIARWHVAEVTASQVLALANAIGHTYLFREDAERALRAVARDTNTRPNQILPTVTRQDLGDALWGELEERASEYGIPMAYAEH